MERKTFLAIALSLMVLFGYEAIFVAPNRHAAKTTQIVENKEVISNTSIAANLAAAPNKTTKEQIKADFRKIGTTVDTLEFSNVGGTLHNITFANSHPLPVRNILSVKGFEDVPFALTHEDSGTLVYDFSDANTRIVKSFKKLDNNITNVAIEISNLNKTARMENISFNGFSIDGAGMEQNKRETMLDEYSVFSNNKVIRKGNAFKFNSKEDKTIVGSSSSWVGFRDHYSIILVKPEFGTKGYDIKSVGENRLDISLNPEVFSLAPAEKRIYQFMVYTGPQDITLMKQYKKDLDKAVAFFGLGIMDGMAKGIYWSGIYIQKIFKSWGLTIILMSALFYGVTYPLTFKSMMSMRKMQAVQPKINALREKYKGDPQKMNAEVVEIYRREKINPLGGCLPMLLQMPIFMAMYQILWRAYYFQGKSFLWIKDLSKPDALFILPFQLPFLGNEFNILPILMAIVMYAQQKISSKTMVVVDEQQAMQQKMMTTIFPIFIGVIFYKFASGLSLYFTVFYLLSALTQYKMSKMKV